MSWIAILFDQLFGVDPAMAAALAAKRMPAPTPPEGWQPGFNCDTHPTNAPGGE